MGSRLIRRVGARCALLAMLFGQCAVVAYACPVQAPAAPAVAAHVAMHAGAGENPCAGTDGAPDAPPANACEVHCSDGVTLPAQSQLPLVALAAQPVPTNALARLALAADLARTPGKALPGAPPLNLQFCRLLI
jgi:hypothetical protein